MRGLGESLKYRLSGIKRHSLLVVDHLWNSNRQRSRRDEAVQLDGADPPLEVEIEPCEVIEEEDANLVLGIGQPQFPESLENVSEPASDREDDDCSLSEMPFSVVLQRTSSELSEDIEHLIFEMAAREDPRAALNTLVFVNHRVRKWVEYVIYESVILRDAKHARLFLDGLERKHPDFAAGAVKILALPTRVSFDTSWSILKACRDIRHLSWLPTNPLPVEVINLIADLPLVSLRARLVSFLGNNPDFSAPLFQHLTTLFLADHQDVWKKWKWKGLKLRPNLKWIAVNLDGRLDTFAGWEPVRAIENTVLKPYGGPSGVQLCVCYHYNGRVTGGRWIHRSEETFSEERMAVLSLDHRIDEKQWVRRINGECRDFEISEGLVREREQEERRLRFACKCFNLFITKRRKMLSAPVLAAVHAR